MPEGLLIFRRPRDWKEALFQLVVAEIILALLYWGLGAVIGISDTIRDIGFVVVFVAAIFAAAWYFKRAPSHPKKTDALAEGDAGTELRQDAADEEGRLVFLDPEVPEYSTKRKAVEVVVPVRSKRSTDAVQCRIRIDSAMSSSGIEQRFSDHSLMWTTGREEETITPGRTQRFQIARSYADTNKFAYSRVTELVFSEGDTENLKSRFDRSGGTFWLSIELSYSNSKPVYGVYRLDSNKLHDFVDAGDIPKSDVVQFIDQFEKRPNLEKLIEEYPYAPPETNY